MKTNPCVVCGSTEVNLSDGYYYCQECGTQDTTIRETVIERTFLEDGTVLVVNQKKFRLEKPKNIEMSPEWYRWHAYNFILMGWTDEVIALGAKPSLKPKVLWIWTRYMKKYQNMEKNSLEEEIGKEDEINEDFEAVEDFDEFMENKSVEQSNKVHIVRKYILLSIICAALNLDNSDIQISDIIRFIKEGRISFVNFYKYIPKEIKLQFREWKNFNVKSITINCRKPLIRKLVKTLFECLDLGEPLAPNFRNLVDRYIRELCLPNEFKNLVLSLMNKLRCGFFSDSLFILNAVKLPDYETIVMSYILLALKMCFGLDDDYEIKLSEAVDKINKDSDNLKSYKLGTYSEKTGRMFSFREWCNFLQFRGMFLCKYYAPSANNYLADLDGYLFMEYYDRYKANKKDYSDEVTMNILDKIPFEGDDGVIPRSKFLATLTPRSTYAEVILEHIKDFDTKLLLSEDFTQYSLTYACVELQLPYNDIENIVTGISLSNKIIKPKVIGGLGIYSFDLESVYVKNCNNKNWLKTKQPTAEHIVKVENYVNKTNDTESDPGDNSNLENTTENSISINCESNKENGSDGDCNTKLLNLEIVEEEDEDRNIFDDESFDLNENKADIQKSIFENSVNDVQPNETVLFDDNEANVTSNSSVDHCSADTKISREEMIKQLIVAECKNIRMRIPPQYKPKTQKISRKRKINDEIGLNIVKKRIKKPIEQQHGKVRKEVDEIIETYYSTLIQNMLYSNNNTNEHEIKSVVNNESLGTISNVDHEPENGFESACNLSASVQEQDNESDKSRQDDESSDVIFLQKQVTEAIAISDDEKENDNHKFDENIYDTRQLYIKFKNEKIELNNLLNDIHSDPEVNEIIGKNINKNELITDKRATEDEVSSKKSSRYSLTKGMDYRTRKRFYDTERRKRLRLQKYLIKNRNDIPEFKYWVRKYNHTDTKLRDLHMGHKFDVELDTHFPKSFTSIIRECAAITGTDCLYLYKHLIHLETFKFTRKPKNEDMF